MARETEVASEPQGPGSRRFGWREAVLIVASVLPHLSVGGAAFTNDDVGFYSRNTGIRDPSRALRVFSESFPADDPGRGLYRPLTALSYMVDRVLFGEDAGWVHLSNLAFYPVVVVACFWLLRRYLGAPGLAFAAALIFAVHPIHCEVVDSVSGRSELLALLASLIALLTFQDSVGFGRAGGPPIRRANLAAAVLSFVAATLAKETSVVLPGVLVLHVLLFHEGAGRRAAFAATLPFFLWIPVYFSLRAAALTQLVPTATILGGQSALTWLSTVGAVAAEYARLLVAPGRLQIDRYYLQQAVTLLHRPTWATAVGWLLVGLALGTFAWLVWRRLRAPPGTSPGAGAVAALGLGATFAWMFPVSHVIPFGALMAERFLFAPSAGLALAGAVGWRAATERFGAPRPALTYATLVLLVAGLGVRSSLRAVDWTDRLSLWSSLLQDLPNDGLAEAIVANCLFERGEPALAIPHGLRAATLAPDEPEALLATARVLVEQGTLDEAETLCRRLLVVDPDRPAGLNTLGVIEGRRGRLSAAIELYERALAEEPGFAAAAKNLADTEAGLARAQAWLDAHAGDFRQDAPRDTLETMRKALIATGDESAVAEVAGWLAAPPEP